MKITFRDLKEKHELIYSLLTEEELKKNSQSKLKYAVQKWEKNVKHIFKDISERVNQISLNSASEDEKTKLLIVDENNNFQYTKENEEKKRKEILGLDSLEFEFEPYFFTDQKRIDEFDDFTKEELSGIFIN